MATKKSNSVQTLANTFIETRNDVDFKKLVDRLKPGISNYLREKMNMKDRDTREDIMTEAFVKMWNKIHQYDSYYAFGTWAYRIARNEVLLHKRNKHVKNNSSYDAMTEAGINISTKTTMDFEEEPDYEFFEPTAEEEIKILFEIAKEEIEKLPDMYRDVLKETLVKAKKDQNAADELGLKINTVKTRKRKAKQLLKDAMLHREGNLVNKYFELI